MTFDPYANQGGTGAWDADAAAATKKAAEKLFSEADSAIHLDDVVAKGSGKLEPATKADEKSADQPDNQPGNMPDPDFTIDR